MATKYYNDATGDHLWSTLGNWWDTSPGVGAAASLPATGDTVLLTGAVTQSSYSATVANLTITNFTLNMNLTVSGSATFAGTAKNAGVVAGTCIFQTTTENSVGANVLGGCTFSTSAKNYGTVTGTTVFDNASTNESGGVIQGGCTFNSTSSNKAGATVRGATTFNSSSTCAGNVTGTCTFNTSASVTSAGIIIGACTFNNATINAGTITGNCTFANTSYSSSTATITGDCTFSGTSQNKGIINCEVCDFGDGTGTTSTSVITAAEYTLFGTTSTNSGALHGLSCTFDTSSINYGTIDTTQCIFQGATNNATGIVTSTIVQFLVIGINDGTVTSPSVLFDATSTNTGTVNSSDCKIYQDEGNNTGVIVGTANFYGTLSPLNQGNNIGGTVTGTANVYWPATCPVGGSVSGATNYIGYNFVNAGISDTEYLTGGITFQSRVSVLGVTLNDCETFTVGINAPVSVKGSNFYIGEQFTAGVTLTDPGFTVKQALEAIYSVWGAGCSDGCDTAYTARGTAALDILNGCLQEILLNAKELQYLSRETIDVASGTTDSNNGLYYYTLPDNVQAVVGPVLMKTTSGSGSVAIRRQLIGVSTKSQLLNFSTYYNTSGGNTIYGYWIERGYQLSGDRTRVRIYVSAPITGATLRADVERESLRYRSGDCNTGTVIPLPHQYAESLLLPLLREAASASTYASRRDAAPLHQAAAAAARARFAQADPQNPALTPKPERTIKP